MHGNESPPSPKLQVFSSTDQDLIRQKCILLSLMFAVMGCIAFIAIFLQVCWHRCCDYTHMRNEKCEIVCVTREKLSKIWVYQENCCPLCSDFLLIISQQGFSFAKSGEVLTLKLRLEAFTSMMRQVSSKSLRPTGRVSHSFSDITLTKIKSKNMFSR